ncbi:AAA family ATPase [Halarsenatibacter silvermanii]|uniref:Exonuclease SbcC n=1 Tax=Halarsenatibacter silvermanii TaxID=321763 RepID=A0A1G9IY99_9FIRM|nr:AAA family ATPase [Halarsenatibacter silvermanii]SDL29933.1 exonuclease SbcC [Halarsenatibacter silvermanii]
MNIKELSIDVFAGLSDVAVEFDDGLNVLYGPNEAGKSTVIKSIHASLFIEPKLKYNRSGLQGKGFRDRFFPHPRGNYAEAGLQLQTEQKVYEIYKKWSNENPDGHLKLPDGSRISYEKIKSERQKLLPYGKSTYENIVFTRQEKVRDLLEKITEEDEFQNLKDTISNFLRRAVMRLGNVSAEKFRSRLNEEYHELTRKWDLQGNCPSNPDRGVNNPYKQARGKIYDKYIEKENLRIKIKEAESVEKEYRSLKSEIEKLEDDREKVKKARDELAKKEEEINKRQKIEHDLAGKREKIKRLEDVLKKWPKEKSSRSERKNDLKEMKKKIDELKSEKMRAEKHKERKSLQKKFKTAKKLKNEIKELELQKKDLKSVNEDKLKKLSEYRDNLREARASLKGSRFRIKIIRSESEEITIKAGLEEDIEAEVGDEVEAEGFARIETEHEEIEVESAELDVTGLKKEYELNKEKFAELLEDIGAEDLEAAREKLQKVREIKNGIATRRERVRDLLGEEDFAEIKERLKGLEELESARELEEINEEIENLIARTGKIESEIAAADDKIEEWQQEYENLDKLKEEKNNLRTDIKKLKRELAQLCELPKEFDDAQDFKDRLNSLRQRHEQLGDKIRKKEQQLFSVRENLPEESIAELKNIKQEKEGMFERMVEKAHKYRKIKKIVKKKLEEIDEQSFSPLVDSFSSHLFRLTDGNYKLGNIDDEFEILLRQAEGRRELPAVQRLLSYGTFDAAALALRFALFDNLFADKDSFLVLDDCLVNLDDRRQENAVELIQKIARDYQVIFSTCSRETAHKLGGNLIDISEK